MQTRDRLIVALDLPNANEALQIVDLLGDSVGFYKVGLELYCAEGNALVLQLINRNKKVFLDLKMNDIPETIARATLSISRLGVDYLTLFTGTKQIEAARAALDKADSKLKLLNVTVLTSDENTANTVGERAQISLAAGADGLICSGLETHTLRQTFGSAPIIVNPGIRPALAAHDDQIRIVTPAMAITGGATNIVVGRPITRSNYPKAVAEAILAEMRSASA